MNHKALRQLTRSDKWQSIYCRSKEIASIGLFNNVHDFTKCQIWFLYYLEMYNSLYMDLNMGEDFITEEVIDDDLRTDAYIIYRNKKRKDRRKSDDRDNKKVTSSGGLPAIKFLSKK